MAIAQWPLFIRQCLSRRVPAAEFGDLARLMLERSTVSGGAVFKFLLDGGGVTCVDGDPLLPAYARTLVISSLVRVSDGLKALLARWNGAQVTRLGDEALKKLVREDLALVNSLTEACSASPDTTLNDVEELQRVLTLTARWLTELAKWISSDPMRTASSIMMGMAEAVGVLLAATMSSKASPTVLDVTVPAISSPKTATRVRQAIVDALDVSLPLFASTSPQIFSRLDAFQKHFDLHQADASGNRPQSEQQTQLKTIQFQSGIGDQLVPSRPALIVFLDAMLRMHPTVDDNAILTFLNGRHPDDHQAMFSELVLASFSLLANLWRRDETDMPGKCVQFITEKLPSLMSIIAQSSYGSFSPEAVLIGLIEPITKMTVQEDEQLCAKFNHVCYLHQLISESAVVEYGMGDPSNSTLLQKDDLVSQMKGNLQRCTELLNSITLNDGNAAAIAQAVVEVMHGYCHTKETTPLKEIANVVLHKSHTIKSISLFIRPAVMLRPLCALLDNWRWDDLHGESQPVYDEWGSVLLLILTFKYQLGLSTSELGIGRNSTFVAPFMEQAYADMNINNGLTEDLQSQLGEWINALFIAEGLSDDITSSCSSQQFYMLVPTILHQSMLAHECGKLSLEALKAGFEYLLEPFLLPSLVPALFWLGQHASRLHKSATIVQMLQILMRPPENADAKDIHKKILMMTASSIKHRFQNTPEMKSTLTDLDKLLDGQKFSSNTRIATLEEVSLWTNSATGGMLGSLRVLFRHLTTANLVPFASTHISTAVQLLGATPVLTCLLEELSNQSPASYPAALDMLTALCCANLSLRQSVSLQYAKLSELLAPVQAKGRNPTQAKASAESLVRLHRRLSLLVPPPAPAPEELPVPISDVVDEAAIQANVLASLENPDGAEQDIDAVLDAAAAAGMGGLDQQQTQADIGGGGAGHGGVDMSMDDVFGDLGDGDGDFDAGMGMGMFDDLDMDGMFD